MVNSVWVCVRVWSLCVCVRVCVWLLAVHCSSPIDVRTLERVPNSICVPQPSAARVERSLSDMTGTMLMRGRARARNYTPNSLGDLEARVFLAKTLCHGFGLGCTVVAFVCVCAYEVITFAHTHVEKWLINASRWVAVGLSRIWWRCLHRHLSMTVQLSQASCLNVYGWCERTASDLCQRGARAKRKQIEYH